MTTIAPADHTMTCDKCGNTLIVPKWSEYVSDGLVLNFWYCWKCGYQFETRSDALECFPRLLVA